MKNEINAIVKSYFENEVSGKEVPTMPEFNLPKAPKIVKEKKGVPWGNILIAACLFGSFFLILNPSTYDNTLRRAYIPINNINAVKEEIPRVIFNAFKNYKEFKS